MENRSFDDAWDVEAIASRDTLRHSGHLLLPEEQALLRIPITAAPPLPAAESETIDGELELEPEIDSILAVRRPLGWRITLALCYICAALALALALYRRLG